MTLEQMAKAAKEATYAIARASTLKKNSALKAMSETLKKRQNEVLSANQADVNDARVAQTSDAMIDRLSLQNRMGGMIADIEKIIELPDPVGESFEETPHVQLKIQKLRTPLGVLGVIYESRPNVTLDIAALAIKSGNCAILRGGSETLRTNKILVDCIKEALRSVDLPEPVVQLVPSSDRNEVVKMLRMHAYIDLIIPRGGASLHRYCRENSMIPVITGGVGVCHLYMDESADQEKSLKVIANAKTQRPTVCNALETLLLHEKIADQFLPKLMHDLGSLGVSFRLDSQGMSIARHAGLSSMSALAQPDDWDTEWLSLVLGVRIVKDLDAALQHIKLHSTGHSDGILTQDKNRADLFVAEIDSAAVYVNASTRFTDGGQFGLGAEVAISTQKLHARGPMGLKELTSYKWVIHGDYTIRS